MTIDVSKGMRPNERITFEGVTDEKPGFEPGHLHFVLMEIPHPEFKRDGDNLYMNKEIPLVDALVSTFCFNEFILIFIASSHTRLSMIDWIFIGIDPCRWT